MQFRKFFTVVIFPFFVLGIGSAQELRTNEKGEKIIVYPDGRWEYFSNFGKSSSIITDPEREASGSNAGKQRYPIFEGDISSMSEDFFITEESARQIANRKYQLAKEASVIAELRAKEAVLQRTVLEKELATAQGQIPRDNALIERLQTRLNAARKTEQETAFELDQAKLAVFQAEELTQSGKYLARLNQSRAEESTNISTFSENADSYDFLIDIDNVYNRPYSANTSLASAASLRNCEVKFKGQDPTTGQYRLDVAPQVLFKHTDEKLKVFLREKEFLRCDAFITAIGGFRFLNLTFTFNNPNAQETYGSLDEGSFLTIKLLDGFINLRANKTDRGYYNPTEESVTYQASYPIDQSQINVIKNSEIDTIMVFWSTGFEEYEVYEVGFFMDQIRCLENG